MIEILEFTYYNTEKIDDAYNEIIPCEIKNRRNISDSKLSDSEIISISIVGEALTVDSEKAWFYFVKKNFKDIASYGYCASKKRNILG